MTKAMGFAVALTVAAAGSVSAQDALPTCDEDSNGVRIVPTLAKDDDQTQPAARLGIALCERGHVQVNGAAENNPNGFPMSWAVLAHASYLFADKSIDVPDASVVRLSGGLSISLSMPPQPAPRDLTPPEILAFDGGGFDYGFVDVGGTIGYESSADRSERHFLVGGEVRYANNSTGWAGEILPSVVVRFDRVDPLTSRVREMMPGVDDGAHRRLSGRGYWYASLGESLTILVDASAFRAWGLAAALEAAGWRDGAEIAGTLGWRIEKSAGPFSLESFDVRFAHGQAPTAGEATGAVTAGISIGIGGGS